MLLAVYTRDCLFLCLSSQQVDSLIIFALSYHSFFLLIILLKNSAWPFYKKKTIFYLFYCSIFSLLDFYSISFNRYFSLAISCCCCFYYCFCILHSLCDFFDVYLFFQFVLKHVSITYFFVSFFSLIINIVVATHTYLFYCCCCCCFSLTKTFYAHLK